MPRPIVPTTLADLQRMEQLANGLRTSHDYYIKEIDSLDKWKGSNFHGARVWCPLNSWNIPSDYAVPNSWLALQGAGDLLMLTAFLSPGARVTTYDKFANIIENQGYDIRTIVRSGPADLDVARLRQSHEYSIHIPRALRPLAMRAIESGWNHYDWMGLCLGLHRDPGMATIVTTKDDYFAAVRLANSMPPRAKRIALHLSASARERSGMHLLESLLLLQRPEDDWHFILLGGSELRGVTNLPARVTNLGGRMTYRETYEFLFLCHAVVAVDSVVLHMANCTADTHVLGLYGWSPPSWSGPRNLWCETLSADSMDAISPRDIYNWLKSKLTNPLHGGRIHGTS